MKILYAEDDGFMAEAVLDMLHAKAPHMIVTRCIDGAEAWEKFQKEPYDLVLTDYRMPYMSGEELAEKIRLAGSKTPVILMSSTTTDCKNRSLFNAILDKTDCYSKLVGTIKEVK